MKNIIINEYGVFLGITSALLSVKKDNKVIRQIPLNRIKTIQVFSKGVSISSNLILECSSRGIKIFFNSYNNFSAVSTLYEHKSVNVRKKQFEVSDSQKGLELCRKIIIGKIKNQRATLLYSSRKINNSFKQETIENFDKAIIHLKNKKNISKDFIMGIEGNCANQYFNFLKEFNFLPSTFEYRTKRHSNELTNVSLNYGYAILFNFIYKSLLNAGLEPYCGILHSSKSAKPSLVLDIMEEYRSFVVDRNIIKLRFQIEKANTFDKVKNNVARYILATFSKNINTTIEN